MPEEISTPTFYSNAVSLAGSIYDFTFMFGLNTPIPGKVGIRTSPLVNIVMSPQHFKEMAGILQKTLDKYESEVGKIVVPPKEVEESKSPQ